MRRVNQIFASLIFVASVLTIYLLFDYAVNRIVREKHLHTNRIQRTTPKFVIPHERPVRMKKMTNQTVKSAQQFHKSKTGVKVNHKNPIVRITRNKTSTKL